MKRKFICLINPISGTKNKDQTTKLLKSGFAKAGHDVDFLPTQEDGNYSYLPGIILKENISDVIICGGDGTINKVGAALIGLDVSLGIIPLGSGNGLSRTASIPVKVPEALQVIFAGKTTQVDAFYMNDRFCCMLAGLGMDAQVALDFSKQPQRGLKTYIQQTFKNFFTSPPFPFGIIADGQELYTDAYFISIANSNQFGNNVTIAPQASLSDGKLDIVVVNNMSKLSMLYKVVRQIISGQPISFSKAAERKKDIWYFQASNLTIYNTGEAPLHIDGDPAFTETVFDISVAPQALRLLVP